MKKMKTKRPTERFDWREEVRVNVTSPSIEVSLLWEEFRATHSVDEMLCVLKPLIGCFPEFKAGRLYGAKRLFEWWVLDTNGFYNSPVGRCLKEAICHPPAKAGRTREFLAKWNKAVEAARRMLD